MIDSNLVVVFSVGCLVFFFMIIQFSFLFFFVFIVSDIQALELPSASLQKSNELN
ncbi:hypothetical protein IFVP203_C2210013 [Vibrio parahaemolyticus]